MEYIVEMLHITKEFPGIIANDDVTLQLKKGEIHALLGENGAGKSTLMSVLFGLYQPEQGEIRVNGEKVSIIGPLDANRLGIGMVHQHFKLVHNFTVLQNILLGIEDTKYGVLQEKEARERVLALSEQYNIAINPDDYIADITVGMQQRVEILKMLYRDNQILILDEPTAVLTPQEIEELMMIMDNLAQEGKSILFITHKLNEIKTVADRCTVLRRGKFINTCDVETASVEELSEMMVGRKISLEVVKEKANPGEVALSVRDLCIKSTREGHHEEVVKNVSFDVRKGEIVCIAGIDGNGQTELIHGISGLGNISSGTILLQGEDVTHKSIRYKNTHGMSHIPEDRHKHGLVLDYNVAYNLVLQEYFTKEFTNKGFLKSKQIKEYATDLIERFDIRSGQGIDTTTRSMSGGNQQKVIIAREITKEPEVLLAVQPTRGLDVGAIEYIHGQIVKERDKGCAVLLVSLELEEVLSLSDRILVMYEGEIVADVQSDQVSMQELGLYMLGTQKNGGGCRR